jgi:hypothetical protein
VRIRIYIVFESSKSIDISIDESLHLIVIIPSYAHYLIFNPLSSALDLDIEYLAFQTYLT